MKYEKEYIQKINNHLESGIFLYQLKNYNHFIFLLGLIIQDNRIILEENKKLIAEKLIDWSHSQKKIKIWKHLNSVNIKKMLKVKKIQEQNLNDDYIQLKFLTKGS